MLSLTLAVRAQRLAASKVWAASYIVPDACSPVGAQRLAASKVWAANSLCYPLRLQCVLNALRHLRFGQARRGIFEFYRDYVLNALRHLRFGQRLTKNSS